MSDIATLIVVAALADNIVLSKMLGLCPFIGTSKQPTIAAGVGVCDNGGINGGGSGGLCG